MTSLLRSKKPVSFDGEFYSLRDAKILPRSPRPGGIPIVIGGNGARRTLPLAARCANEWNGVYLTPEEFVDLDSRLGQLTREAGRVPDDTRTTL